MSIATARDILLWCSIINYCVIMIWFLLQAVAGDRMYRIVGKWFRLSREQFDTVQLGGMIFYKVGVFIFNLIPYIVLRFLT